MPNRNYQTVKLGRGHHRSPDDGEVCVMELASMLEGEHFTDHPRSVCPVIAAFLRGYNDSLDDTRRQTLKRYAAECIGTRADPSTALRRRALIGARIGGRLRRSIALFWLRDGATVDESGASLIGQRFARQVARRDDDALHAEVLALVDAMIATGPPRTPTVVPGTPERELATATPV